VETVEEKNEYEVLDLRGFVVKPGMFYVFEAEDLQSEKDLKKLLLMLFLYPESDFYFYQEENKPHVLLNKAVESGDILINEYESFYYENPQFIRHYEHIPEHGANYDWQRELVAKGPMFIRMVLKLSERKKRALETWEKIQLEEIYRKQLKDLENSRDVFLSYASVDKQEANMIYDSIKAAGGKVFLSEKSLMPGEDFAEIIRDALCAARELWLLVSPSSLRSEWVLTEWGAAWALNKRIIPILHRCSPENLPERLRKLQCVDFYKYLELVESTFHKKEK
jgi:hypothetical protein